MTGAATLPAWAGMDQAARDAAYDNVAAVADSAETERRRLERSAALRLARRDRLDRRYGPRPRNRIDLFGPEDDSPCLFFIHGGYWVRNDGAGFACVADGLLRRGWAAAVPSYTLAPAARLSAIAVEIGRALDWYARYRAARRMGGPLLLAGWSAGATLALLHAAHPCVHAVLAISGLYDLAPLRQTSLNDKLQLSDDEIDTLSPLRRSKPQCPVVVCAGNDELPAIHLACTALARHLGIEPEIVGRRDHFSILDELADVEGRLCDIAIEMVA